MIQKRLTVALTLAGIMLLSSNLLFSQNASGKAAPANPQVQGPSDQDIDLLRKDIRSQKKQIIAANLKLTDKEAEKFWPVYDQYTADLVKINDVKYAAIKEYATNYATLTDEQAVNLVRKSLEVDASVAQLRLKYLPPVSKVISGKNTALFFQMDRRLGMLIDLQLASQIPMVEP